MLGIIGGMGPEASCYFYENVIAHTKAEKDQEHIDMVLLMSLIYDDIKAGKNGDRAKFDRVVSEFMRKGCDVIILACTELSVFKGKHEVASICLDAMDVLVEESIRRSGAEYVE